MTVLWFTLLTTIGSGLWNGLLIGLGWVLGDRWEDVGRYVRPLSSAVVIALVAGLAWFVWSRLVWRRHRANRVPDSPNTPPSDYGCVRSRD